MNIEIQTTPDKNVINFFPDQPLKNQGSAEYVDRKTMRRSPFAEQIFDLGGINSIFITQDMISVTKNDEADWQELKPLIMAEIMDYLSINDNESENFYENTPKENEDIIKSITALLNARIRPAIKRDGGDIKFVNYEDGIVTVEMLGACKGCPYALRTLKNGVEKILKTYIPEIKEVRNIEA